MPFIVITASEFLYAIRYFLDDDKHGWNGLTGLGIIIWLFIPTLIANLTIAVLTMGKLQIRVIVQVLVSIGIFIYYWSNSLH